MSDIPPTRTPRERAAEIRDQERSREAAVEAARQALDALGPQTILIRNERIKLLAGALDRGATSLFTVGILAPVANGLYGVGRPLPLITLVAWFYIWLFTAVSLHLMARRVLRGLR